MKRQLRVFISSTISECAAERAAAKAAVSSLRHQAILFEDLGASPHAPRPLYVRELTSSDVFVGIYGESYGWVATGAKISGVDDEHRLRTKLGLPPLIYVLRPAPSRDVSLTRIIDEASTTSTLRFYSQASELEEAIAKDLAALVAEGFDPSRFDNVSIETNNTVEPGEPQIPTQPDGLDPLAYDLLSSLAVAAVPFTVEELAAIGNDKVSAVIRALGAMEGSGVVVRGNEVTLTKPAQALTEQFQVLENDAQVNFYAHRAATILERSTRFLEAYTLFDRIRSPRAKELLPRAAREAVRLGQIDLALPLLRLNVEQAQREGWADVAASFLLSSAVLSLSAGNADSAIAAVEEATKLDAPDLQLMIREVALHIRTEAKGDTTSMRELFELRRSYEAEGDHYGVARVAVTQSKLFIELRNFGDAISASRVALELFTNQGDEDGRHVALHNLMASLSAGEGNEDEVRHLTTLVSENRASSLRFRAFQCNLTASRLRQAGDAAEAVEVSREAIAIGEQLGDVSLQLTNRINLGNALSDLGKHEEAIAEYKLVSAAASTAGLRLIEGSATRLLATTLNEAKRWTEALTFAQYAAGLLHQTVDVRNFVNSKCEEAIAQLALGKTALGLRAYREAALSAHQAGLLPKLAGILLSVTANEEAALEDILEIALAICETELPASPTDAVFLLASQMTKLLKGLPVSTRGRITRALFARTFASCPPAALGRVTLSIAEELLANTSSSPQSGDLQIFANFLIAFDPNLLSLRQWNVIAEKLAQSFPGLVYKPFSDGASHWTITVDQRLIASVSELDDSPASFAATTCLAAGLFELGGAYLDALGTEVLPRREATVQFTTRSEFIELIGERFAPDAGELVTVTRAANEADEAPPAIHVILDDNLDLGPHDSLNGTTIATYLLRRTSYEMARHLLKGQVAETALVRRLAPLLVPFYS